MKKFHTVIFALLMMLPLFFSAQKFGNITLTADKRLVYERIFEVPDMTAEDIQSLLIAKMTEPGIVDLVHTKQIITAKFYNFDMITYRKKTKLIDFKDGWRHFYGKIRIDIKDKKYRVTISQMGDMLLDNEYWSMEEITGAKKPIKRFGNLVKPIDTYFGAFFTISKDDNW